MQDLRGSLSLSPGSPCAVPSPEVWLICEVGAKGLSAPPSAVPGGRGFTAIFERWYLEFSQSPPSLLPFIWLFAISWAASEAYGGSQARGLIGAAATGLRQSHSNSGSELSLPPTPQLTATPDR